ncbi:hypothetical protein [Candidatus Amarobacter glycogenicus]|nr:hypothetical protein [Dehalococcoidia bacterium]
MLLGTTLSVTIGIVGRVPAADRHAFPARLIDARIAFPAIIFVMVLIR